MNFLPKELEDIIIDYKNLLENKLNFDKCIQEMKHNTYKITKLSSGVSSYFVGPKRDVLVAALLRTDLSFSSIKKINPTNNHEEYKHVSIINNKPTYINYD